MIEYKALIHKFNKKGEKTGWTYIIVPTDIAQSIKPGNKKSFRVKGRLDNYTFNKTSLLPMGGGEFMFPLNSTVRKAIKKAHGAILNVCIEEDKSEFIFNADFIACLKDDSSALLHFKKLPMSHQKYFSKWIDSAKTDSTKVKRITMAINALSRKLGFAEMLRAQKK